VTRAGDDRRVPASAGTLAQGGHPALGACDHVGQIEGVEVRAHVLAEVGPHGEQDALSLVIAGSVLVRKPEVAATMGPSTADTIWDRVISSGGRAST
jgi:hypothetical protein